GGAKSNTAHKLSTATKIKADKAWIGAPSATGAVFASPLSGGKTSIGTAFTCTSLIFGGVSTNIVNSSFDPTHPQETHFSADRKTGSFPKLELPPSSQPK